MSEDLARSPAPTPTHIVFSQSSLNDYVDCARRFQLRYVLEQQWPAVESEPLIERERQADLGRRFHRLIQQHVHGLPVEGLARSASADTDLVRWWQSYLAFEAGGERPGAVALPSQRRAEVALSVAFGSHRLAAQYDLLAMDEQRAVIVDWKTERKRPDRSTLLRRLQTRVYRYVLAKSNPLLAPESISMVYWFAKFPAEPEVLTYDSAQSADDEISLHQLLSEIEQRQGAVWPLTADERRCRFCTYRSLCERGVRAGVAEPDDADVPLEIDLEEIDEIAY